MAGKLRHLGGSGGRVVKVLVGYYADRLAANHTAIGALGEPFWDSHKHLFVYGFIYGLIEVWISHRICFA